MNNERKKERTKQTNKQRNKQRKTKKQAQTKTIPQANADSSYYNNYNSYYSLLYSDWLFYTTASKTEIGMVLSSLVAKIVFTNNVNSTYSTMRIGIRVGLLVTV